MTNKFISFANRANTPPMGFKHASRILAVLLVLLTFGVGNVWGDESWNLTTNSYSSATTDLVTWSGTNATMTLAKNGGTNANNYLGGSNGHTRVYSSNILKISPASGQTISSIEITATSDSYTISGTWTNGSASTSGSKTTITPTDGTKDVYCTCDATKRLSSVVVKFSSGSGGGDSGSCDYTEASSLSEGDEILLLYESGTTHKQLSSATGTSDFTTCPSTSYKLTVEKGYNNSNLALKNSAGKYLAWSSSTTCAFVDNKTDATRGTKVSWTTETSGSTLVLKNVNSDRYIMYKTSDASVKAYASLSQSGAAKFKIYKLSSCTQLGQINGSFFWTTHFCPVWPVKHRS